MQCITMNTRAIVFFLLLAVCLPMLGIAATPEGLVYRIQIKGVIDPVTAQYVERGVETATRAGATCLLIELDTPGGLDVSMRRICKSILNSSVPVVVYITPSGARSASAGVFITLAAHISAMSPGTNIGAAHPVDMQGKSAPDKITNDAAAYIRSIAEQRGKNAQWAQEAVQKSSSLSEMQAIEQKVVDISASNLTDLLKQLNGRVVTLPHNEVVLNTVNAKVMDIPLSPREGLLHLLSNPNIAYLLLIFGIYGIIFEFATPGIGLSGITGGICLLLALVSMEALPFNLAGLILILVAIAMFIVEIKTPTHGALGLGGTLALLCGSLLIFSPAGTPQEPYISAKVSWVTIITMTLLSAFFFLFVVAKALQAMKRIPALGTHLLINAEGIVKTSLTPEGIVHVKGEEWRALSADGSTINTGEKVKVLKIDGLTVHVQKL